jgi:hypothetical protein
MMKRMIFVLCLAGLTMTGWAQERVAAGTRPEDAATQRDFQSRVSKYYDLRNKLGAGDTKQTESVQEVKSRQEELAKRVQQQRSTAKHGDIFSDEIRELFKRNLRATYRGKNGTRIETSLSHSEPLPKLELHVNQVYPQGVPLQSTPPTILMNLPRLPKGLEYRFVGRDLILYDSATNLIVDYLHEALPSR